MTSGKLDQKFLNTFHHRSYSLMVDDKDIANFKEKIKKNPFWIPKNNSDLFTVKTILDNQKNLKRNIQSKVQKSNKNLRTVSKFNHSNEKILSNKNYELPLKTQNYHSRNFPNNQVFPELIDKKINEISKPRESVKDMITKTRELALSVYSLRVKDERIKREHETYNNEIESIKDSIYSMKTAKIKFNDDFTLRFDKYMKFLTIEREKAKTELDLMLYKKGTIESSIKQTELKIIKFKEKYDSYQELKNFLFTIKNKNDDFQKIKKPEIPDQLFHTALNTNINRFSSSRSVDLVATPKIYDKPSDLIEEIKKLSNENIELLQKYNNLSQTLYENVKELKNLEEEDKKNTTNLQFDLTSNSKMLKNLVSENAKLKEERNLLLNENDNGLRYRKIMNKDPKIKLVKSKLYSKILKIYEILPQRDLTSMIEKSRSKNKIGHYFKQLDMLTFIEKCFQQMNIKYNFYLENNKVYLKEFEKEIEVERKSKMARDLKIEDERKRQKLKEKISNRYNKVYVLPKRKIPERKKIEKFTHKYETDEFTKYQDDMNFEDLINY